MVSKKSATGGRRLRESTETVRERSTSLSNKSDKKHRLRPIVSKLGGWSVWKPFRFLGRLGFKYLIPPYFKNSVRELRMVTWPDRRQTRQLTFAVIIFSIVFGVLVALVDYGLDKLFKKVILHI